ncbi:hypothetical protein ACLKA6_019441 [Drosophila palustris]
MHLAENEHVTTPLEKRSLPLISNNSVLNVDSVGVGVAAGGKTNTPEDPYVFTETVAATPPILFNAQKSRARLSEAQHSRNSSNRSNNNKQTVAGKKSGIVGATAAAAATTTASIAQLNGNATATTVATVRTAAAAVATTKAQASLGAASVTTTTTNFNNVTQSQRQPASQSQLQLQLQSSLQLQPQTSPKRATNVCVVRPQQQLQQQQLQQQQQQQQQLKAKLTTKHPAPQPPPPPPLYTHTPSLWQTPLLLDATQKQQQQQQPQQQLQSNIVVATALVSPPTSPASLPSPTGNAPPTAAVTAMVSPIVLPLSPAAAVAAAAAAAMSPPKGGSLPPSKFHHTTLAQHLQKVECLKKKKSLPLACQNSSSNNNNNHIVVESLHKRQTFAGYNQTHPPPLTAFNTTATGAAAIAVPAVTPVEQKKHSADAVDDNGDLNEIPVNVIFRKPPVLLAGPEDAKIAASTAMMKLGTVAPLTPPTPPSPASSAVAMQLPVVGAAASPALMPQVAAGEIAELAAASTASINRTQNEQMSSKVGNSAAPTKRRSPATNAGCRKANKTNNLKAALKEMPLAAVQQPEAVRPIPPVDPAAANRISRRRKPASGAKRGSAVLFSENEPLPPNDVPYCLQKRWLHFSPVKELAMEPLSLLGNRDREERIAVRKGLLRRQALQLLSTRPLQELPMRAARQRLQGVHSLLLKYQDHANQQQGIGIGNRCLVAGCKQPTLSMAAHCERHIVHNGTQQLFQPCVAWRVNGSACQTPVFDMLHTLALCPAHSQLRPGLELQSRQQLQQQQLKEKEKLLPQLSKLPPTPAVPGPVLGAALATAAAAAAGGKRKRKTNPNANPVGRPLKRAKKQPDSSTPATLPVMSVTTLPPMQRKSSTTSLESIASNSQSSAKSHTAYTPTAPVPVQVPVPTMPQLSIIPPALAPLSDYQLQQQQQLQLIKIEPEQQPQQQQQQHHQQVDSNVNLLTNANFKADEISQIVAQLTAASTELHNNNNNSLHYNNNNNNNNHNHNSNNTNYCSNNNSNSGSSSISCGFPSFNAAFGNAMSGGGLSQQATPLHAANTSLASTESLLSHHMFGICENSSAYASSEDTGLGGLSESELIGANEADDIALNGAHLLEEHDLVNVFDTLPDDAFNELFQSVQQAECEAMDRALEIADKNLKCLQQTIGSTAAHDSAFLNDFLDVGDDLLVNAVSSVMNSPNTSGIDASTLFVDSSGSASGNSSSNGLVGSSSNGSVADLRGMVHI